MTTREPLSLGRIVFDLPTRRHAAIIAATQAGNPPFWIYTLDSRIPDDPDFPHRHRLRSEIRLTQRRFLTAAERLASPRTTR